MTDIYEEIVRCRREGKQATLVTVINTGGSVPREVGAKMLVFPDGSIVDTIGGATMEVQAIEDAKNVTKSGKPATKRYDLDDPNQKSTGMICGGWVEVFIEPLVTSPTLTIFGAGHCGRSLAEMADILGWNVVIIDDRPDMATKERFPFAKDIIFGDFSQSAENWESPSPAFVVIMTYGHKHDEIVLSHMLTKQCDYLGMIASRKKKAEVFRHLTDKGVDPKLLENVYSPVGLDIASETPAEIAVSILAEIIQLYRTKLVKQA